MQHLALTPFFLFCGLAAAAVATTQLTSAQEPTDAKLALSQLLPEGEVELEFLDVALSERGAELASRFSQDTDREWLATYVAEVAQPGQDLPYHPNFGLSEKEYSELMVASKEMTIRPIGVKWQCLIKHSDQVVSFEPIGHRSAQLSSIRVNVDTGEAEASSVQLGRGQWDSHTEKGPATGPWRGFLWKKEIGDQADFLTGGDLQLVKLEILHLIGTEYVLLNQKTAERINGRQPTSREFMLRFRVPDLK